MELKSRAIRNGKLDVMVLHPMRAKSQGYKGLTYEEWQDPNYIYEIKFEGERQLLHVLPGTVAMVKGVLHEKGEYVPHLTDFDIPELHGTVIDGEIMHPSGEIELLRSIMGCDEAKKAVELQEEHGLLGYIAYDILYYKGGSVMDKPFKERRKLLENVIKVYQRYAGKYIDVALQFRPDQFDIERLFNDLVINSVNEGFMRKDLRGTYKLCDALLKSEEVLSVQASTDSQKELLKK